VSALLDAILALDEVLGLCRLAESGILFGDFGLGEGVGSGVLLGSGDHGGIRLEERGDGGVVFDTGEREL